MVSKSLKIVIAGPHGSNGGLEIHTTELVNFLASQGHEVLRIYVNNQDLPAYDADYQVVISNLPGFRGKFVKSFDWFLAGIICRKFSPDLLISTAIGSGYKVLSHFVGSRAFRIFQIVTDDYPANNATMLSLVKAHDAVAPQTQLLKEQFIAKIPSRIPSQVLPCFHQIGIAKYHTCVTDSSLGQLRLAYFGRLVGNKGIPLLLDAWSKLDCLPLVSLDIWGLGKLRAELQEKITNSPSLSASVTLKGLYPSGLEYVKILSSYHGLVLPSQSTEGLPLVLLEAASVGLPILTTRVGGIPDFAKSNPDVLMVDLGLDALCNGLQDFIGFIHNGAYFNRERHMDLFLSQYSRGAIESIWFRMLEDPFLFFTNGIARQL